MRAVASIQRLIMPLVGVLSLALPVQAGSNLLENSPFLPTNAAAAGKQDAAPLELRSILKSGGDYEFSLYDLAKKQSTWTRLNEPGHDFVVKTYDPQKDTVTVEQRNRTYKLVLIEGKITPLRGVPQPPRSAGQAAQQQQQQGGQKQGGQKQGGQKQGGQNPGGGTQSGQTAGGGTQSGSAPALTPEQVLALEADINRRRDLRRQATASPDTASSATGLSDTTLPADTASSNTSSTQKAKSGKSSKKAKGG